MNSTKSRRMASAFAIAVLTAAAIVAPAGATEPGEEAPENWPQFRGPNGMPVSNNPDLPTSWSTTENVEWVADLIPELEARKSQFIVDTEEVDDEFIEVFIEELRRLSGELSEGARTVDLDMIRMAAHSIKGMGGTIGLPEISVLGLEIENTVKEDRLDQGFSMIDALAQWIATLD